MLHVPERGEVWQVDFGITQKVRPALVISIPFEDTDRALIGVVPHTTAVRGSQFEVRIPTPFLYEGAFLVQGIQAIPPKYFLRCLGVLKPEDLRKVERVLMRWQGFRRTHLTCRVACQPARRGKKSKRT
jgi:mRNA interferase MazF